MLVFGPNQLVLRIAEQLEPLDLLVAQRANNADFKEIFACQNTTCTAKKLAAYLRWCALTPKSTEFRPTWCSTVGFLHRFRKFVRRKFRSNSTSTHRQVQFGRAMAQPDQQRQTRPTCCQICSKNRRRFSPTVDTCSFCFASASNRCGRNAVGSAHTTKCCAKPNALHKTDRDSGRWPRLSNVRADVSDFWRRVVQPNVDSLRKWA